jgi:hypothetical protein
LSFNRMFDPLLFRILSMLGVYSSSGTVPQRTHDAPHT